MFLVNGATGSLSSLDLSIMKTDEIDDAIVVGGTAAVGTQVSTQLSAATITPIRESGPNRSATAEVLADFAITTRGTVSYYVLTETPSTAGCGISLVFTVAPLGNGSVGIRADGLVIDSDTGCVSAGDGPTIPAG